MKIEVVRGFPKRFENFRNDRVAVFEVVWTSVPSRSKTTSLYLSRDIFTNLNESTLGFRLETILFQIVYYLANLKLVF